MSKPEWKLDLDKIKADADTIASKSDQLLMAISVKDVQGMLAEIEQIKAENESLRSAVAGKVVCDLDFFEDLRDSAASEADEHRQHMATYRPQRQEVLDWTVKRCDALIAELRKSP